MLLGVIIATALIAGSQLPLLHQPATVHVNPSAVSLPLAPPLAWPSAGPAALYVPSLGVLSSHDDHVVPIASLTKMMTAYVALLAAPLGLNQIGPCYVVTGADVTTFQEMEVLNESSILVVAGEQLCELDLLNGLLVHSAGNYAVMLATMIAGSPSAFVARMNAEAIVLGLAHTHYDDVTGFSSASVSTARDQAILAAILMKSALVRFVVLQRSVTLPVAGTVGSFTPYVGYDNVIGVKSGRTAAAGGCDVMAVTFYDGSTMSVLYAVVLDQRGGDLLGPAGVAALSLANSAVASRYTYTFAKGSVVGAYTWGGQRVAFGFTQQHNVSWWPAEGTPRVKVQMLRFTSSIRRGEVVGHLTVYGVQRHVFILRSLGNLSPPSLLQRLR
jgi:D-alanyl-D-alanine carboxypeptidase (penicillin-binding protein 5/6)